MILYLRCATNEHFYIKGRWRKTWVRPISNIPATITLTLRPEEIHSNLKWNPMFGVLLLEENKNLLGDASEAFADNFSFKEGHGILPGWTIRSFGLKEVFSLFLSLPHSSISCQSLKKKNQYSSYNLFSLYIYLYIFFFWISYKIINIFQFHLFLIFNLSNLLLFFYFL